MVTFLVLIIVIPTLTILTRLENRRSRRKVSIDGFKMINGRIVFGGRAEDRHARSAVDADPTTALRRNRNP